MNLTKAIQLIICYVSLASCSFIRPPLDQLKKDILAFEQQFSKSLEYLYHNETVKLIGYKTVKIPSSELTDFEDYWCSSRQTETEYNTDFYDPLTESLRIYFPVEGAMIEHDSAVVEANHLGELDLDQVNGDVSVIGRKQTDHIHGVDGNIIKDGVIYLAEKNHPKHRIGKVFVYDFGQKTLHSHGTANLDKREDRNQGCLKNHGGVNCSTKYNIHHGRCPFRSDTCMDYNGPGTDCQKAQKVKYFRGSDCYTAVSQGHCWNEMESAAEGILGHIFKE
jgi:hypothetical protein